MTIVDSTYNSKNQEQTQSENQKAPDCRSAFSGKKFLQVIACKSACPLSFNGRLVYSYLIFKLRDDRPVTAKQIGALIGLEPKRTVPRALEELSGYGLAQKVVGGWVAKLPSEQTSPWFSMAGAREFYHWKLYLPHASSPFTATENALYCLGLSIARGYKIGGQTHSGLAKMLGVSRLSVIRHIKRLNELKLMRIKKETHQLMVKAPKQPDLLWWRDTAEAEAAGIIEPPKPRQDSGQPEAEAPLPEANRVQDYLRWRASTEEARGLLELALESIESKADRMRGAGYSFREIVDYWNKAARELQNVDALNHLLLEDFDKIWGETEEVHDRKGKAKSSYHLLLSKTQEALPRVRHRVKYGGRLDVDLVVDG